MKTSLWKRDWVTGLLTVILVLAVHNCTKLVDNLERSAYDAGVRGSSRTPQDNIAILAIDEASVQNIGRWPWSRDVHAEMIRRLNGAGAKVIAYTPIFSEPQIDPGLHYINDLVAYYQQAGLSQQSADGSPNRLQQHKALIGRAGSAATSFAAIEKSINEIEGFLREAQSSLNVDQKLAAGMAEAKNVITPMWFLFGQPLGNPDSALPEFVQKLAIQNVQDNIQARDLGYGYMPLEVFEAITPITDIGSAANAVGNINNFPDVDGGIRSEPLVVDYFQTLYPSYALLIAARSLNLGVADITVKLGEGIQLGRLNIGTDG
ncbi:MAG TPA: CHASE2 domain-containing protein, partial [Gammaproteobacteria bacterium]